MHRHTAQPGRPGQGDTDSNSLASTQKLEQYFRTFSCLHNVTPAATARTTVALGTTAANRSVATRLYDFKSFAPQVRHRTARQVKY